MEGLEESSTRSELSDGECINQDRSTDEDISSTSVMSEWLAELSDSDLGEEDPVAADDSWTMERCGGTARMFKLRRALGQLDHFHQQKEQDLFKTREKLNLCRQHIEELLELRAKLERETEKQKTAENSAAVFRLRAQHKTLCEELRTEEELEALIRTTLQKHELELCEAEVELARVSSLRQDVQDEERRFRLHKQQTAARRQEQGRRAARNRLVKIQQQQDKQTHAPKTGDAEDKKTTNKKTARLFRETMLRAQQQEADQQQQSRELLEKRSRAVRSLKSNIDSIRLQQTRVPRREAGGLDKGRTELERLKQREFEERQKSKRLEISAKIHQEEKQQTRRKQQQQKATQAKAVPTDRASEWASAAERLLGRLEPRPPSSLPTPRPLPPHTQTHRGQSDSEDSPTSDPDELEEGGVYSLEQPEFCGLWDHHYKEVNKTKAVRDKHATASEKFNTPATQVLKNESKGPPFRSKPHTLLFKDFEVNQIYKKKMTLTNISYSTNVCRFLGVSAPLKDFMSVSFEPPGLLSTGMSCDLQAVFHPMVNEDLEGEIQFVTATASFSVPVKCITRKCQLVVDTQCIDFGSHVVGQTVSRTLTLTNQGALACLFSLDVSDSSPLPLPSQEPHPSTTAQEASQGEKSGTKVEEAQPQVDTQEASETEALDEDSSDSECNIQFGSVTKGEIGPFQSIKLNVLFKPTIPGETKLTFYIRFSDRSTEPISVQVKAAAVSVPVWVSQPTIDLKICLWDQLYHHWVCVQSRANTALKLTFEVCPELKNHMDIVPRVGFIQAKSSFKAQFKFQPRPSLAEDAGCWFDPNTGVLEVPLSVQVAGQVLPARFVVTAVLTSSDLRFDRSELDFGPCSVHQSVRSSVALINRSLLPQDFGFYSLPEFVEVQPNDGFGTLLPQETLLIDLIFSPKKAQIYGFTLSCKSGLNRDVVLSCRAVGVRPSLELSHTSVQFGATALGHSSRALLYITNTEPPPSPGPRLFCFTFPDQSDVSVAPSAGRLSPGERCLVLLTFRPSCSEFREENSQTQAQAKEESPADISRGQSDERPVLSLPSRGRHPELTVACCVSEPWSESAHGSGSEPAWSPIDMLFLKLLCPVVQPPLVVTSSSGQRTVDFHCVTLGEKVIQKCVVQNISDDILELSTSLLPVGGPFSLLNALRPLPPEQSHPLLLAFSPLRAKQYCERLEVRSCRGGLRLTLCGEGVLPEVTCSHPGPLLDFGYVLAKECTTQLLKLQNHSAVEVGFRSVLSSQSPSRYHGEPQGGANGRVNEAPEGISGGVSLLQRRLQLMMAPLYGNLPSSVPGVFSVVPAGGRLAAGQSQDLHVCFQPTHESWSYSDHLRVELSDQSAVCALDLKGASCCASMYVSGGDPLPPLSPGTDHLTEEESVPVLVTLRAAAGVRGPALRELQVGCVRSTQTNKKSAEFFWDNVGSVQQLGFSVEPIRGAVEPGGTRTVSITWAPPSGYKPHDVVQGSVCLTLKAEEVRVYRVTLMALVSDVL